MANSISSIGSSTSAQAQRAQTVQNAGLKNNAAVLNDIVRTQGGRNRVALATPAGSNSKTKLPRGSLVDVLA